MSIERSEVDLKSPAGLEKIPISQWLVTLLRICGPGRKAHFWEINISVMTAEFIICVKNVWIWDVNEKILDISMRFSISRDGRMRCSVNDEPLNTFGTLEQLLIHYKRNLFLFCSNSQTRSYVTSCYVPKCIILTWSCFAPKWIVRSWRCHIWRVTD